MMSRSHTPLPARPLEVLIQLFWVGRGLGVLFIYLLLTVQGLAAAWALLWLGGAGVARVAARSLLIAVAFHRARALGCVGTSNCGSRASQGAQGSAVVVQRLSCSEACVTFRTRDRA